MRLCAAIMLSDGKHVQPEVMNGSVRVVPYAASPVEMAKNLQEAGIDAICVYDHDSYRLGYPANIEVTKQITEAVNIPVYSNGNIKSIKDIDTYTSVGVKRLVVDMLEPDNVRLIEKAFSFFDPEVIAGGLPSKNGMIMHRNSADMKNFNLLSMISEYEKRGMKYIMFVDHSAISEGTDPDYVSLQEILSHTDVNLAYCGRIQSNEQLKKLQDIGVYSCLLTSSLYEKHMSIEEMKKTLGQKTE